MAILTRREFDVIAKIKKLAETTSHRDKFVHETLGHLKTLIPYRSAVFFDVNPASLEFTGALLDNLDKDFLLQYFKKFYNQQDLLISLREFLKKGYACKRSSELIALKSYMSSSLYTELLSQFGCHYFLASCFTVKNECFGYLILWRERADRDFSKKHVEVMRIVAPQIARGVKDCQRSKTTPASPPTSDEERLLQVISKRSPPGLLIFDHNNRVLYKNEQAQTIFYLLSKNWTRSNPAANEQPQAIPSEILELCNKLRAASASKNKDQSDRIACLTSTVSFGLQLYSIRGLILDKDVESQNPPSIAILIENVSQAQRFDLEKARDRYQLTFKEKEIVQFLLQGFTNKEVAKELCIGNYTLKDHLKNIRQKMGVFSRTGILSKVAQF